MTELPRRTGPRPRTTPTNPHSQLDQHPPAEVIADLARGLFGFPGVREAPSMISVPGARAAMNIVMLYAPRDAAELNVVLGLLRAGYEHARGETAEP